MGRAPPNMYSRLKSIVSSGVPSVPPSDANAPERASAAWREELPWTIEAFYGQTVIYQRFLDHFRGRLTKHEVPHVALDPSDWHAPFRSLVSPSLHQ